MYWINEVMTSIFSSFQTMPMSSYALRLAWEPHPVTVDVGTERSGQKVHRFVAACPSEVQGDTYGLRRRGRRCPLALDY
jgi:hypothetical protein